MTITHDHNLSDYKVKIRTINHKPVISGDDYFRNLNSVVRYLHKTNETIGYYCIAPSTPKFNDKIEVPTFTNQFHAEQQSQQTTTVHIEFTQTIVTLTEKLTNLERDFPDNTSKEHKFAKRLKSALSTAKDTLGVTAAILSVASELRLDPSRVAELLGLG